MRHSLSQLFVAAAILACVAALLAACSTADPECDVQYDDGGFEVVLNPPGETGDYEQRRVGSVHYTTKVSSGEEGWSKTTEYKVDLIQQYEESGNRYKIDGAITAANPDLLHKILQQDMMLVDYDLTVTGGAYEDTPLECTK